MIYYISTILRVEYIISNLKNPLPPKQGSAVASKVLTLGHTTTHSSYGGCNLLLRILYVWRLKVVDTRHSRHMSQSRTFMTFLPFSLRVVEVPSTKQEEEGVMLGVRHSISVPNWWVLSPRRRFVETPSKHRTLHVRHWTLLCQGNPLCHTRRVTFQELCLWSRMSAIVPHEYQAIIHEHQVKGGNQHGKDHLDHQ